MIVKPNEKIYKNITFTTSDEFIEFNGFTVNTDSNNYECFFRVSWLNNGEELLTEWFPLTAQNLIDLGSFYGTNITISYTFRNLRNIDAEFENVVFKGTKNKLEFSNLESKDTFLEGKCYGNPVTNMIASNLLEKVLNAFTPSFIGKTADYVRVFDGVSLFFASFLSYAKRFKNIINDKELLSKHIESYGIYAGKKTRIEDLRGIAANIYREKAKRGTVFAFLSKEELSPFSPTLSQVDDYRYADGEVLRILDIEKDENFIFKQQKSNEVGWNIGNTSPCSSYWSGGHGTKNDKYSNLFLVGAESMNLSAIYRSEFELYRKCLLLFSTLHVDLQSPFMISECVNYELFIDFEIKSETVENPIIGVELIVNFHDEYGNILPMTRVFSITPLNTDSRNNFYLEIKSRGKARLRCYIADAANLDPYLSPLEKTYIFTDEHTNRNFLNFGIFSPATRGVYRCNSLVKYMTVKYTMTNEDYENVECKIYQPKLKPIGEGSKSLGIFLTDKSMIEYSFKNSKDRMGIDELSKIKEILPYNTSLNTYD